MTWDQISGFLRPLMTFLGGFAVAWGWIGPEALGPLIDTILQIGGALVVAGGLIWGIWANTRPALVVAAAKIVPIPAEVQKSVGVKIPVVLKKTSPA